MDGGARDLTRTSSLNHLCIVDVELLFRNELSK